MQAEGLCKEGTQGDGSAAAWQIDRADERETCWKYKKIFAESKEKATENACDLQRRYV